MNARSCSDVVDIVKCVRVSILPCDCEACTDDDLAIPQNSKGKLFFWFLTRQSHGACLLNPKHFLRAVVELELQLTKAGADGMNIRNWTSCFAIGFELVLLVEVKINGLIFFVKIFFCAVFLKKIN